VVNRPDTSDYSGRCFTQGTPASGFAFTRSSQHPARSRRRTSRQSSLAEWAGAGPVPGRRIDRIEPGRPLAAYRFL